MDTVQCTVYGGRRFYRYIEDDFRFQYDLYQAIKQHGYTKTLKQREAVN